MDPNHPKQPDPNPAPPPSDPAQQTPVSAPQPAVQPPQPQQAHQAQGMPNASGGFQPQPGQFPQQQKTNTLAIVTLILAFVFPIAALVTGFIALSQIKKSSEGGRGLAIGGLVISVLQFLLFIVFIALFAFSGVQELARDAERKTDVNALRAYIETYAAENDGYYPPELDPALLPGADLETFSGPQVGEVYTYTVLPLGCTTLCESYTISTVLEEEGEGTFELSGQRDL